MSTRTRVAPQIDPVSFCSSKPGEQTFVWETNYDETLAKKLSRWEKSHRVDVEFLLKKEYEYHQHTGRRTSIGKIEISRCSLFPDHFRDESNARHGDWRYAHPKECLDFVGAFPDETLELDYFLAAGGPAQTWINKSHCIGTYMAIYIDKRRGLVVGSTRTDSDNPGLYSGTKFLKLLNF